MAVTISGGDQLRTALARVDRRIQERFVAAIAAEAAAVVADARSNVRVDSGDLQGAITAEISDGGLTAQIGPRASESSVDAKSFAIKANVNEFGRANDPGQAFMLPAAEASRRRWPDRARAAIKDAVDGS